MFRRELRAFTDAGLRVRRRPADLAGLVVYGLVYQLVMSPISFSGYVLELSRARRVW